MQISVSGQNVDMSLSLKTHVESEIEETVKKYFEAAVSADIVFSKERHLFKADIIVNEGTGKHMIIKASAEDDGVYSAFDMASAKIEKQLRRYKDRIKGHNKKRPDKEGELFAATKYVISPTADDKEDNSENDPPLIIAEKPTQIERITVSDAVMRMDLGQLPALMFINKKTDAVNVVYRREDGNISWIDSSGLIGKSAA